MSVFVDTNVLVYARDSANADKQASAQRWMRRLWESGEGRLSIQVLNEMYVTLTRKLRPGIAPDEARAEVTDLLAWQPLPVNPPLTANAWSIEDRFGFSFWDSLIVAAAQAQGCEFLLSEDLQSGQDLGGVTVVDPFTNEVDGFV